MYERKKLLRILASLAFVLFLIGVLPGVGTAAPAEKPITGEEWMAKSGMEWGANYWPTKPVRGGVFQAAGPLYIGLMNPNHWPVNDWVTISYFYDKLIWTDGNYKPTVPWLAESWKYLDPKTVIMKLRQGVQFHDGSLFNAESLKYQMDWIMDPQNGAWTRAWMEPLASIEVVDTYTVKWNFKRPWAAFLGVMANVPGYVISAKALKAEGAKPLDSYPVGTGEFMLDEASPGNYVRLKRNPNWWFGKFIGHPDMPYLDGLHVSIIPDPSVRLANLRAGKLDSMAIDPSQYPMVKNDRSLNVYVYPLNWVMGMRFNHKDGPCKDLRVRKAISHALDRTALINGVAFGLGDPASGPYPYQHWAHNPNLKPVPYNPELSKELLAEAGYKNGLTIKGYMLNETASMTGAEAIKNMLAKVGITWNVEILDPAAIAEKLRKVDYDFAGNTWTWIYDPDLLATGWYHPDGGFNFGRSHNEKAISLIEAGRAEVDDAKRTKIYWELEKVLYDNYEDAWLLYPMAVALFRKNVQGWNHDMFLKMRDKHYWAHPLWFKDGKR